MIISICTSKLLYVQNFARSNGSTHSYGSLPVPVSEELVGPCIWLYGKPALNAPLISPPIWIPMMAKSSILRVITKGDIGKVHMELQSILSFPLILQLTLVEYIKIELI